MTLKKGSLPDETMPPKFSYKKSSKTVEIKMGYSLIKNLFASYCSIPQCFEPTAKVVYTVDIPVLWLRKRGVDIDSPVDGK